jgi:hypothetical protein
MQYTNPKYTYRKDGVFYFSKQVPSDVRSYYSKATHRVVFED